MKPITILAIAAIIGSAGCSNDQAKTREQAAKVASEIKQESKQAGKEIKKGAQEASQQGKAIAEGAREGWNPRPALRDQHVVERTAVHQPGFLEALSERQLRRAGTSRGWQFRG